MKKSAIFTLIAIAFAGLIWLLIELFSSPEQVQGPLSGDDLAALEEVASRTAPHGGSSVHRDLSTQHPQGGDSPASAGAAKADIEARTGVRGRILDGEALPVAGALVTVRRSRANSLAVGPRALILRTPGSARRDEPLRSIRTDAQGRFEMRALPPAQDLVLDVDHELLLSPRKRFEIPAASVRDLGDIRLRLGAAVAGRLCDSLNEPLANAWVRAEETTATGPFWIALGSRMDDALKTPRSDAQGRFRVGPLDPLQPWRLVASASATPALRRPLAGLTAGQVLDLGTLLIPRDRRLTGRVLDGKGAPVAGARIQAFAQSDDFMVRFRPLLDLPPESDAQGRFAVLGLPEGLYRLQATTKSAYASRRDVAADASGVELRFSERSFISGIVVAGKSGKPLAGAHVELLRAGDSRPFAVPGKEIDCDGGGLFRFEDIRPSKYRIRARDELHAPATSDVLEVGPAGLEGVRIALEPGAVLNVHLLAAADSRPISGALVELRTRRHRAAPGGGDGRVMSRQMRVSLNSTSPVPLIEQIGGPAGKKVRTDAEGRATLRGLATGSYSISAEHADFARTAQDLEIPAIAEQDLELRMISGGTLRGRVLSFHGEPLAKRKVLLEPRARSAVATRRSALSGANGDFRIDHIVPGEYIAKLDESPNARMGAGDLAISLASGPDSSTTPAEGEELCRIADQSSLAIELHQGPVARLRVTVLDHGLPAPEARVSLRPATTRDGRIVPILPPIAGLTPGRPVDEQGQVEFEDLKPGRYAVSFGLLGALVPGSETIDLAADEKREISVEIPGASIAGLVVENPGGQPLPDVEVRVAKGGASQRTAMAISIVATSDGGGQYIGGVLGGASTHTDARGRFRIEQLPAGKYHLEFKAKGFGEASSDEIVLAADQRLEGLVQELSKGGSIAGKVFTPDGLPAAMTLVRAQRLDDQGKPAGKSSAVMTAENGTFELEGLAAATYRLRARQPRIGGPGQAQPADPSSMPTAEKLVTVAAGARATCELRLAAK